MRNQKDFIRIIASIISGLGNTIVEERRKRTLDEGKKDNKIIIRTAENGKKYAINTEKKEIAGGLGEELKGKPIDSNGSNSKEENKPKNNKSGSSNGDGNKPLDTKKSNNEWYKNVKLKTPLEKAAVSGKVTKEYAKKSKEDDANLRAANKFSEITGINLTLIKPIRKEGERTADAIETGKETKYEIKTNYEGTKNSIDNAVRSAKDQADNVILDITNSIPVENFLSTAIRRVIRKKIQVLYIIYNNNIYKYTLDECKKIAKGE